jgi:hypothetical protein
MRIRSLVLVAAISSLATPVQAAQSPLGLPISDAVLQRRWAGSWIACAGAPERDPGVFRFRKTIELEAVPSRYVVHVSADQRFVLHVNGRRVGSGPSRGDILFWRFETFDLAPFLKPGAPGFRTLRVEPHLGNLQRLEAALPAGRRAGSAQLRPSGDPPPKGPSPTLIE